MASATNLTDLKGVLLTRAANLESEATRCRDHVILLEAQLLEARKAAASSFGALQGTRQALADVDQLLQAASKPAATPVPQAVGTGPKVS